MVASPFPWLSWAPPSSVPPFLDRCVCVCVFANRTKVRFLCGFHKEWERVSKREMMKRAGSDKRRSASGLAPLEWIARLAPWSQLFSAAPVHRSGFKFVVGVGVCVAGPHRFGLAVVRSRIARTDTGWMTSPAWAPPQPSPPLYHPVIVILNHFVTHRRCPRPLVVL